MCCRDKWTCRKQTSTKTNLWSIITRRNLIMFTLISHRPPFTPYRHSNTTNSPTKLDSGKLHRIQRNNWTLHLRYNCATIGCGEIHKKSPIKIYWVASMVRRCHRSSSMDLWIATGPDGVMLRSTEATHSTSMVRTQSTVLAFASTGFVSRWLEGKTKFQYT